VQRLQELDIQDRYNVLEFLVKELIGLKKHHMHHDDSHLGKSGEHSSHKPKKHVHVEDVDDHPKDKRKNKHANLDIEEISVDSDGSSVKKSSRGASQAVAAKHEVAPHREEWEEELTSTQ
jgi:hypothetical protein